MFSLLGLKAAQGKDNTGIINACAVIKMDKHRCDLLHHFLSVLIKRIFPPADWRGCVLCLESVLAHLVMPVKLRVALHWQHVHNALHPLEGPGYL